MSIPASGAKPASGVSDKKIERVRVLLNPAEIQQYTYSYNKNATPIHKTVEQLCEIDNIIKQYHDKNITLSDAVQQIQNPLELKFSKKATPETNEVMGKLLKMLGKHEHTFVPGMKDLRKSSAHAKKTTETEYRISRERIIQMIRDVTLCGDVLNDAYVNDAFDAATGIIEYIGTVGKSATPTTLGFCTFAYDENTSALRIDVICTHKGVGGIGTDMLKYVEALGIYLSFAQALPTDRITLESITSAVGFYAKRKFLCDSEDGDPVCPMVRPYDLVNIAELTPRPRTPRSRSVNSRNNSLNSLTRTIRSSTRKTHSKSGQVTPSTKELNVEQLVGGETSKSHSRTHSKKSPEHVFEVMSSPNKLSKSLSKSKSKSLSLSKSKSHPQPQTITKKLSIGRKKSLEKKIFDVNDRLAKYLAKMCPEAGDCLGFGKELDRLKTLFEGYTTFKHLVYPIRLLARGGNGFVNHLTYLRNGYISYAILKNTFLPKSDNLMYEAFVGLNYINKQTRYFPCFLETYAAFKHINPMVYRELSDSDAVEQITDLSDQFKDVTKSLRLTTAENNEMDIGHAVLMPELNAVLIEYIPQPWLFHSYLSTSRKSPWMIHYELPTILFQVYAVLASIQNEFTHYDLHVENVALYIIPKGKYVTMTYHTPDHQTITFNTRVIVKIMDYGRSYCPMVNSYYNSICRVSPPSYGTPCGADEGHRLFVQPTHPATHFIGSLATNTSHDLRLAHMAFEYLKSKLSLSNHFGSLLYRVKYAYNYGTVARTCPATPDVCNVKEMYEELAKIISTPAFSNKYNTAFKPEMLDGTMHIYLDRSRELRFVGATGST